MGADSFLFTAMMHSESCMPARCWMRRRCPGPHRCGGARSCRSGPPGVGGDPARVDTGAGGAHDAAQDARQLLSQLDAALDVLADAAAHGNHHVGADQIDQLLGGLLDLQHIHMDVGLVQLHVHVDDLRLRGAGLVIGWVCMTPGRTVDIWGRKRGQMMVAIR